MAAAETTYTIGTSGIVLDGPVDAKGCLWGCSSDNPRGAGAAIRENTGQNANRSGMWDATQFVDGQTFPIKGWCNAPTHDLLHDAEERLRAIMIPPTFTTWTLTQHAFTGIFQAMRTGDFLWTQDGDPDANLNYRSASFSFTLRCLNPYITSSSASTFVLGFPTLGGLDRSDPGADRSDPGGDRASTDAASTAVLVNDGPVSVPLNVTVSAGVTNVVLTLQQGSTTQVQRITNTDGASGPLTTTGQTLVVDNKIGSARLNGTGRNSWLGGDLLMVPPGTSGIYLTGVGTGNVTVSFSSVRP